MIKCIDCNKPLNTRNKKTQRCIDCYLIYILVKEQFCIDCGKQLNKYRTAKRCYSCNNKYQWKTGKREKPKPKFQNILTKDFLEQKYIKEHRTAQEIANILICSKHLIYNRLRKYNISIRSNSESHIGQDFSEERKKKYSIMFSGSNNPNFRGGKLKLKCDFCDQIIYKEPNELKGKKHLFCNSQCMGKYKSNFEIGEKNPNYKTGKPICEICGKLCRYYNRNYCSIKCNAIAKLGEGNPNWKNGISKTPYSFEFDNNLKLFIRNRDKYKCQHCGKTEKEELKDLNRVLSVHNIDYNKQNCNKNNLITTCLCCNIKANYSRDYWFAYYTYIIDNYIKEK